MAGLGKSMRELETWTYSQHEPGQYKFIRLIMAFLMIILPPP